jgi:hypothetical protein
LLIVRDVLFGVRRFGDFAARLEIPRAVLTSRLAALVAAGVLALEPGGPTWWSPPVPAWPPPEPSRTRSRSRSPRRTGC